MSRRNLKYISRFLMLAFLLLRSVAGFATYYTSVASGDWSNSATWSPAGVPVSGDEVNINSGHTVTYNGDLSWTGGTITINGGGKLIVQGAFTISGGSFNFYDNSDLQVSGNFSYQRWDLIVPSNGSLTVSGNLSVTNGSLTINEAGELSVIGTVLTSANLTNGGTISIGQNANISGAVNNNSQKQLQVGGALSVGNTFTNDGSITVGGNLSATSSLKVNSSAQLTVTGTVSVSASLDNNGTISVGQSTTIGGVLNNNNPSFLHVGGDLTVTTTFNNNATADIDGNLTLTSGDLNVNNPSLIAIDGDLIKSNNVSVNGTLVVGGDFISKGGNTTINSGGYYYVFGSLSESGEQANCTSTSSNCFPNDACSTCQIRSGSQWIANSSPGNPYISYNSNSWWENHLANIGENAGSAVSVCPNSSSAFSLMPEDDGNLAANTFEWAVYGGTITSADHSATINGHTASVKTIVGGIVSGKSSISVTWESSSFVDAYVAVRQTSANGCSDGKWSVFRIKLQGLDAPTGNAQTFCVGSTVADLVAAGIGIIKWYSTSTGGTALASTQVLTSSTYYASQTVAECESQTRLAVAVTLVEGPTAASAGPDQTGASTCGSTTVTLAANTPTVGTGVWSIFQGGGGSFADTSNPATTFTGTAGSTYILRWTISNSPCSASTDDVVITFNENPTASADGSQTICQGGSAIVSGASASKGTILWSHNGSGTLSNETTLTPTYMSAIGDAGKTVTLMMTLSNGNCPAVTATYSITVDPTSVGGSVSGGTTICSGSTSGQLTLGSQTGSVVKWQYSVSPFTDWIDIANTATSYTPSALTQTTRFRAVVQSGNCSEAYSTSTEVTVEDKIAPVITQCLPLPTEPVSCVSDIPEGIETISGFLEAKGEVTDNCTATNSLTVTFADVISHDGVCKVTRTYTIKDEAGNQAICTQTFTIDDTEGPVINSVEDIQSASNDNSCGANLTINQPAPTDITENCSLVNQGAYYQYTIGGTPYSGYGSFTALFPEGTTLIAWTVADVCGHVSDPIIQTVKVGINLTAISYDNGSTETGSGSGVKPVLTSTHKYIVDGGIAETGFTYQWKIYTDANGNGSIDGSDVEVSTGFTMSPGNDRAEVDITFNNLTENVNYILSVIKTKNLTTCEKQETLPVTIQANTFDTELKLFGNNCQSGETNTPSTILWEVDFVGNGVAPYSFGYAVTLDGTPICSGTVLNITLTGTNLTHSSGCDTSRMPYMRVVKTATDSYKVRLEYTLSSITAHNFQVSIQISNATDRFTVTQIVTHNNSETLQLWGVPNTSAITTD